MLAGLAVNELKRGGTLSRYISMGASVAVPDMWFEDDELVTSEGDRFPKSSVFRYRFA